MSSRPNAVWTRARITGPCAVCRSPILAGDLFRLVLASDATHRLCRECADQGKERRWL